MADDQEQLDSLAFSAQAHGIFEGATDLAAGRAALVDAFKSATWTNPSEAESDLEYYGKAIRQKLENQDPMGPDEVANGAPLPAKSDYLPQQEGESDHDYYSRWEEQNLEYLKTQKTPEYLVSKEQWQDQIKEYASQQRRIANAKQADVMAAAYGPVGEVAQEVTDLGRRALRGAVSYVEPIVNSVVNAVPGVDNYELNSHLTEYIDPRNDGKFLYDLAEGAGSAAGSIAAFAAGPLTGTAALLTQAGDAVGTRYDETLRKTGDKDKADKAALIEAGSQTLQIAGERLVFGKLGKTLRGEAKVAESRLAKTLDAGLEAAPEEGIVKTVAKDAATEGVTEGAGQFISQKAEDIEQDKTTDLETNLANSARAGALGAIVGGGSGAVTHNISQGKANSNTRELEISEDGHPITPVTKQVVGQIQPAQSTQNLVDSEGYATAVVDEGGANEPPLPTQENLSQATDTIPATPAFKTADGKEFLKTEDGFYVTETNGVRTNPHDTTVFLDEDAATNVASALSNGENVILGENGAVAIERIGEDGTTAYEEIPTSNEPAPGTYAMGISRERSPNNQTKERLIDIPRKVESVAAPVAQSGGAAAIGEFGAEESTYSLRVAENPLMQQALRSATGFDKLYPSLGRDSFAAMDLRAQQYLDANGIEGAVKLLQGGDPQAVANDPTLAQRIGVFLHNFIDTELHSGDPARVELANQLFNSVAQEISDIRTTAGQTLVAAKGIPPLESLKRQTQAYSNTYDLEAVKIAQEEGTTPAEVKAAPVLVEQSTKEVEQATQELQAAEAVQGAPITTQETLAEDQAVADIEAQASEKLSTDLQNIEQEESALNDEIRSTEVKATRQRRKDIATIEEAIATDGEALLQEANSSVDLTDITKEESAKLNESITNATKAAEEKANVEIKKAVAEERKNKAAERKSATESAMEAVTKANEALTAAKIAAQERIRKLTLEQNALAKEGKDTSAVVEKIKKVEESLTKATQRKANAEQRLTDIQNAISEEAESNKQAEEIYKELESGVSVTVTPKKRGKRAISLKTKKSGLDVTKLFARSRDVGEPLSVLSRSVNELADVVRTSIGARAQSNENLKAIENRIKQNKAALENARAADKLSAADRKRVEAARKRLEKLAQAKSEASLESRVSPRTKKLYKDLKDRQANRPVSKNTETVKAANKKLQESLAKQRKALKLLEKQKLAQQLAAEAAKAQSDKERKVQALQKLLKEGKFAGTTKESVEIELKKAEYEANPTPQNKLDFFGSWVTSLVGNPILTALAVVTGVVGATTIALGAALPLSLIPAVKNLADGKWSRKLPFLHLLAGITEKAQFSRSLEAAKIALTTGERVRNTVDHDKIRAALPFRIVEDINDSNIIGTAQDALSRIQKLEWNSNPLTRAVTSVFKTLSYPSGIFMRTLAASEAIIFGQAYNGFARYKNAAEYNRAIESGSDASKFNVKPSDNIAIAEAKAAAETKAIRDAYTEAGIEAPGVTKAQERVRTFEILQQMNPEETQVFAYKMASNLVLNGPAGGMAGAVGQILGLAAKSASIKGITPLKYFTAFSNSIAHMYNLQTLLIPGLGQVDTVMDRANLDVDEKAIRLAAGLTGTTIGAAIVMQGLANLDLPDDQRLWDITGTFSNDKEKQQAFLNSGGSLRSIRIGNTWIPYNETGLGAWLAGIASVVDRKRDAKEPDAVLGTTALQAAMESVGASIGSLGSMSMVSGITNFASALKTYISADKPTEEQQAALVRAVYSPVRGFIPSASFYKYLAKYTDNPVDTKRDVASVLVEGIPGLQSMYGKPALNVFGEKMKPYDATTGLYRLFSNRTDDLEIRWLADNGYQTPGIANLNLTKSQKELTGMAKPDYEMKYNAMLDAAPAVRSTVRRYREYYGSSAKRKEVQKQLTKDIQSILAQSLSVQVNQHLSKK